MISSCPSQFQAAPPSGGATGVKSGPCKYSIISSRAPLAGRDPLGDLCPIFTAISTRAPLAVSDPPPADAGAGSRVISTRAPLAGSDRRTPPPPCPYMYFNPRSPCGERRRGRGPCRPGPFISTRAPLAGSDIDYLTLIQAPGNFNPRSPCGERQLPRVGRKTTEIFQPALPVRGATGVVLRGDLVQFIISTRAPLAGSDVRMIGVSVVLSIFQPALPLRGATRPPT